MFHVNLKGDQLLQTITIYMRYQILQRQNHYILQQTYLAKNLQPL